MPETTRTNDPTGFTTRRSSFTTERSRGPFCVSYHVVSFLAEPEEPRGLPARPGGEKSPGAEIRPTKGSYPLGDSSARTALRYARTGEAPDQWVNAPVTVGIEVKKK